MTQFLGNRRGVKSAVIAALLAGGAASVAYAASYNPTVDMRYPGSEGFIKIDGVIPSNGSVQTIAATDVVQFVVQDNVTSDDTLHPRNEMFYKTIDTGDPTHTFQADYQVVTAKDTTIAQLLRTDASYPIGHPDRSEPVLFISADRRTSDGKVRICERKCSSSNAVVIRDWGSAFFNLKIVTDAESADVTIKTGTSTVTFGNNFAPKTNVRMRFGAYHHDTTTLSDNKKRTNSKADIRATGPKYTS